MKLKSVQITDYSGYIPFGIGPNRSGVWLAPLPSGRTSTQHGNAPSLCTLTSTTGIMSSMPMNYDTHIYMLEAKEIVVLKI